MALPYCLTNPTLRLLRQGGKWITLERMGAQAYKVWSEGVLLGEVKKGSQWLATGPVGNDVGDGGHKSRQSAIEAILKLEVYVQ